MSSLYIETHSNISQKHLNCIKQKMTTKNRNRYAASPDAELVIKMMWGSYNSKLKEDRSFDVV